MKHDKIERNLGILLVFTMLAISAGGMVEIIPLFFIEETVEKVDGVRPYTPLEQRGRDIYVREGCYLCHSQMIRPFRDEALRYGHYSLAAESKYDHPFQWGSKRTGPDLARVGGKYSNSWHTQHLIAPRSLVPESVMPNYPWLATTELQYDDIQDRMRALRRVGVPYSNSQAEYERNVEEFGEEIADQLHIPNAKESLVEQAKSGNYDTDPSNITEMDALVAYLQVLGTMVDFKKYDDDYFVKFR
ncbi:cytochrome-c oxidase, cbb3-type subunit II [Methylobacillus flagellatus]|uniref:Cytochrome c oxidase, cbb3-type, subunit II n=1 Tax=Methylobacillus flagellatus (strain ATCC 51484 / DSM 6875 / VKM B-1610 / KT) TaxID=265072 RepID=Q1H3N7_METFK|nr:cytochrome-c oxidase, cbb3-type subunit II [Methylobacillus flagellatus]ABE48900.1 cytochrome c oxidase, cbb3-type, subunit II [Methylobacillus flagellatus KT]